MNFLKIAIWLKWCAPLSSIIMCKMKKMFRAILKWSPKNTILQHLILYNPKLRIFSENPPCEFWILWCTTFIQKIKRILRAVLEKNWGLLTTIIEKHMTQSKWFFLYVGSTHSVICVDCIILSRTSMATSGLFSTKSGSFTGVNPTW